MNLEGAINRACCRGCFWVFDFDPRFRRSRAVRRVELSSVVVRAAGPIKPRFGGPLIPAHAGIGLILFSL